MQDKYSAAEFQSTGGTVQLFSRWQLDGWEWCTSHWENIVCLFHNWCSRDAPKHHVSSAHHGVTPTHPCITRPHWDLQCWPGRHTHALITWIHCHKTAPLRPCSIINSPQTALARQRGCHCSLTCHDPGSDPRGSAPARCGPPLAHNPGSGPPGESLQRGAYPPDMVGVRGLRPLPPARVPPPPP